MRAGGLVAAAVLAAALLSLQLLSIPAAIAMVAAIQVIATALHRRVAIAPTRKDPPC